MYDDLSVQDKFNTCKKIPLAFARPYFVINFGYVYGIALTEMLDICIDFGVWPLIVKLWS